jgi:hypothetical protein
MIDMRSNNRARRNYQAEPEDMRATNIVNEFKVTPD